MRGWMVIALVLLLTAPAMSQPQLGTSIDLSNKGQEGEPAFDGREGGETIEEAFPIPAIPFTDTGATCDNINDYDEMCPYGGMGPDVVYVYTCDENRAIDIDLCDSLYDTKVYVYDFEAGHGFGNPIACNDDAGCGYSGYQSRIEALEILSGHTYHIVVDGYGNSCGDYILVIEDHVPCSLSCPPDAELEGEPPLVDDYVDNHNSGCSHYPEPLFQLLCGDENSELTICCNAGNYSYQGTAYRDTDWFTIYKAADPFGVTAIAEYPTYIFQLGFDPIQRCEGEVTVDYNILLDPCVEDTLPLVAAIGEEVWVWGGCAGWEDYPEYLYIMSFEGIGGAHTPAKERTWGGIKGMFK